MVFARWEMGLTDDAWNPIERLWLLIKAQWFSDFVAKTADDLIAHLDKALLWAMGRQEGNRQTCTIKQEL